MSWELVRCTNPDCHHEHTRQARGRRSLPCIRCLNPMEVLALEPVAETPPGALTPHVVVVNLRAAAERCADLAISSVEVLERAKYSGRAAAFGEAAEMAEHLVQEMRP